MRPVKKTQISPPRLQSSNRRNFLDELFSLSLRIEYQKQIFGPLDNQSENDKNYEEHPARLGLRSQG